MLSGNVNNNEEREVRIPILPKEPEPSEMREEFTRWINTIGYNQFKRKHSYLLGLLVTCFPSLGLTFALIFWKSISSQIDALKAQRTDLYAAAAPFYEQETPIIDAYRTLVYQMYNVWHNSTAYENVTCNDVGNFFRQGPGVLDLHNYQKCNSTTTFQNQKWVEFKSCLKVLKDYCAVLSEYGAKYSPIESLLRPIQKRIDEITDELNKLFQKKSGDLTAQVLMYYGIGIALALALGYLSFLICKKACRRRNQDVMQDIFSKSMQTEFERFIKHYEINSDYLNLTPQELKIKLADACVKKHFEKKYNLNDKQADVLYHSKLTRKLTFYGNTLRKSSQKNNAVFLSILDVVTQPKISYQSTFEMFAKIQNKIAESTPPEKQSRHGYGTFKA